ncbi:MAG: hypothetical protein ACOYOH_29085, partial [Paracraurococcus sp.]
CVALFEFLTGGLPLGAALVLLLAAVQVRPPSLAGAVASLAAFGAGFLLPFALKLVLGHLAFSDFLAAEAGGQLLHRIAGPVVPEMSPREVAMVAALGFDVAWLDRQPLLRLPYTLFRFGYFGFVPGAGATWLGVLLLGGGALAVPVLAWRGRQAAPARVAAILGACVMVLGWYAVFLSHTLLHAAWMIRCSAVLPIAAGLLGLLVITRSPPSRHSDAASAR